MAWRVVIINDQSSGAAAGASSACNVMFEFHKLINCQRGRLLPAAADSAKAARALSSKASYDLCSENPLFEMTLFQPFLHAVSVAQPKG
jgi:hypothetical protein